MPPLDATAGAVYFAEVNTCVARAVDLASGKISTIAGSGVLGIGRPAGRWDLRELDAGRTGEEREPAGDGVDVSVGDGLAATEGTLSSRPMRLSVDSHGNILITDAHQCRVRRVDAVTKIMTTVAGNGAVGFAGDGGLAVDAALNWPHGGRADPQGNLFIADTLNYRIRRVDAATKVITTVAGNGTNTSGFATGQPPGLFEGDGGAATAASVVPNAVAIDGAGNLFISDQGNHRIRRVCAQTGTISTVLGCGKTGLLADGPALQVTFGAKAPRDCVVSPDDRHLFVLDSESSRVGRLELATGQLTIVAGNGAQSAGSFGGDGEPATDASLAQPYSIALSPAGETLYILDSGNGRIRKVDLANGVISTAAGNGFRAQVSGEGDGGQATAAAIGAGGKARL